MSGQDIDRELVVELEVLRSMGTESRRARQVSTVCSWRSSSALMAVRLPTIASSEGDRRRAAAATGPSFHFLLESSGRAGYSGDRRNQAQQSLLSTLCVAPTVAFGGFRGSE
jgi:hypothetical protein